MERVREFEDYNIASFIQAWTHLTQAEAQDGFHNVQLEAGRFALTGLHPQLPRLARLNPLQHRIEGNTTPPVMRRDYDSLLGFTPGIPIRTNLVLYPFPNASETLQKSIKFKIMFQVDGDDLLLDPHRVPNVHLGGMGLRTSLRVFFPALYNKPDGRSSQLSQEEHAEFYDNALRPAIVELFPEISKDWPTSFTTETFRARNHRHGFQNGTKLVADSDISVLSQTLVDKLAALPMGVGVVYMTQVRGVKDATRHETNELAAEAALDALVADLDIEFGAWLVDVGLEFQDGDRALLWRTDAHSGIVESATQASADDAARMLSVASRYAIDTASHILGVSGFRASTSLGIGPASTCYIQAYTSDKNAVYHLEAGKFAKFLTVQMAMDRNSPYLKSLAEVYSQGARELDVAARVEVRVLLDHGLVPFLNYGLEDWLVWQNYLVSMPRETWWNFRLIRLSGARQVLSSMNDLPPLQRSSMPSLTAYAAITWFINGLHNRPPDDTAGRAVVKVALPLTQDWNSRDLFLQGVDRDDFDNAHDFLGGYPYNPCGLIFLREMVIPPESNSIRLLMGRELSIHGFYANFGTTEQIIRAQINGQPSGAAAGRREVGTERYPMRKGLTKPSRRAVEDPSIFPTLLDQTPAAPEDIAFGPDITPDLPHPPDFMQPGPPTLAERLAHIWGQYASDILQKLGNPRQSNAVSYCRFSQERRELATIDTLKTTNLRDLFTQVQLLAKPSYSQWLKAFDALFPKKGQAFPPKAQNWDSTSYHQDFRALMAESTNDQAVAIRLEIWEKFSELFWAPAACFDRMWPTKVLSSSTFFPRGGRKGPQIIWNYSKTVLTATWHDPDTTILREEEEESSSNADDN